MLREQLLAGTLPSWLDNLKGAKEIGDVKIYACSMTMGLFKLKFEDLEPIVDGALGIAAFVEQAKEGNITLFI